MRNFQQSNPFGYGIQPYPVQQWNYPGNPFVYGPYVEGPSSQMIPPNWFAQYVYSNPYVQPSYVPNTAYLYPQYNPANILIQR